MASTTTTHATLWALLVIVSVVASSALEINRLPGHHKQKRAAYYDYNTRYAPPPPGPPVHKECMAYEPFRCPGKRPSRGNAEGVVCISIQYLCDGAPDCPTGYDEDPRLCTAAKRPPVEETASFLQSLLASHGPNYLEKLFGPKARNALYELNGVQGVAVALSESQTIDDFGSTLHLAHTDVDHLRSVFMAVENGDIGMLKSLGIKDSELGDVKFFLEKLVNTGFLD